MTTARSKHTATLQGNGKVLVTGCVPTEERRLAVADVVQELLPDHQVVNQTTVAPATAEPKVEEIG